jgi:hypothetical protein
MTRLKNALVLTVVPAVVSLAVLAASRPAIRAQPAAGGQGRAGGARGTAAVTVQEALLKPFDFPFEKPTPLEEVAAFLAKALDAPVVIDRAALDRQQLQANDDVQLRLQGVRLKTGLKLLLDQLGLTYQVVPEDNLLILTDATGSADPLDRVLTALKSLHDDLHDTQDAVDEIRAAMGLGEEGARMRKPTIIEEVPVPKGKEDMPRDAEPAPGGAPAARTRPGA